MASLLPKGSRCPPSKLGPHWPVLQKRGLIICSLVTKASSLGVALETELPYWMGEITSLEKIWHRGGTRAVKKPNIREEMRGEGIRK